MTLALVIIFGLLGLAVGSFLNVCIDRLPYRKSLIGPPSNCDACHRRLSIKDLIPVISYLWLRGRCRYCGAHIPIRVPLVEIGTGALIVILFSYFGLTWQFLSLALFSCALLVLAVIDLKHRLLLNVIIYPTAIIAFLYGYYGPTWQFILFVAYALIILILGITNQTDKLALNVIVYGGIAIAIITGIFIPGRGDYLAILGGVFGFAILLLPAIFSRTGMGWGDVKMGGMIGFMTGFPGVLVALMAGIMLGALTAIVLILIKKKGRKDMLPFGQFLAIGAFFAFLYGKQVIEWYLNLF